MADINTQFQFDIMPGNAYLEFMRSLSGDSLARTMDNNFGWFYDQDDTIYDDRNMAEARFVSHFSDYFDKYRRLARIAKQLTPAMRKNHRAIYSAYYANADRAAENDAAFIEYLNRMHDDELVYRKAYGQFSDGFATRLNTPIIDRFKSKNLGGWGISTLKMAREPSERIYRDGMVILNKYYNKTGWLFRLRHPLAMGNQSSTDQLMGNSLPISGNLHTLLGETRSKLYDMLTGIEPSMWTPVHMRHQFDVWMNRSATALFQTVVDESINYLLTPIDMPSVLLMAHHTTLPVVHQRLKTASIADEWQLVSKMSLAQVMDGDLSIRATIDDTMLQLGWLVAMAVSILSMNLKVGTGQDKLTWIHSTLNAATVGEAMTLAPMILQNAWDKVK